MIYAPVNTFHVLDLKPEISVVRSLMSRGLDVYLLDWGYPNVEDLGMSLNDYVERVDEAVHTIRARTKTNEKIPILGYCWGGIVSLIYAALHIDNVQSLALMATPVDFSKDDSILANWSRVIDVDKIVDEFGSMNGHTLDLAFLMRNPPRYSFDKYLQLFKRTYDKQFVETFIAVERWLYDTPPIPGKLYQQIINDCYKNNLLVSNNMKVDGKQVDLRKIDVPLLTIVAEEDDIVSPSSTLAVSNHVSTKDTESIIMPGGHVGLCISEMAHKKLWPEAARWILSN
jgi:polyhydroxyalkanoate synthase